MSKKKSGGRHPAEGKETKVGPNYSEERYRIGWGGGVDHVVGNEEDRTVYSPNGTTFAPEIGINREGYSRLWDGD